MLRQGATLFSIADTAFAMIMPGIKPADAHALASLANERLGAVLPQTGVALKSIAFPEEVHSLTGLENLCRSVAG